MKPARLSTPGRLLFWALGLAAIVAAVWWASTQGRAQPAADQTRQTDAERPVPVVVAPAVTSDGGMIVEAVGTGLALRSASLQPAVAGEVARVRFKAGDRVRAGQPLLELVDRRQRLNLKLAAAKVEQARRLLARYDATAGTGAVPGSVIDAARSALQTAEVEQSLAAEALAERTVRAPFDGVVGLAQVDPGDRIAPDDVITVIDDRRRLRLAFDLPEPYLPHVRTGHPVLASSAALGDTVIEGRVQQLDNRLDPATRSLRVRAELPNENDLLRPGMSFTVRLNLPGGMQLQVPDLALQWAREGGHVWVVRDGKAQQVPVQLLRRREGVVLIDGELRAGEPVVVEGVQRLRPGRPVRIVEAAP
ncbi:efflux RND transporter periplasmic adaptor subunit [Piscinibacter sakaiensis]|uniref:efflux RND transporter periplasmic adaptor subunit n=1 Tax=Piscinibacter sakaiensis TaxID=1547922 RepID=UPI003AAD9F42